MTDLYPITLHNVMLVPRWIILLSGGCKIYKQIDIFEVVPKLVTSLNHSLEFLSSFQEIMAGVGFLFNFTSLELIEWVAAILESILLETHNLLIATTSIVQNFPAENVSLKAQDINLSNVA